jgi:acetyltransferase-like isoleucine patch superfamily enzyme
VRVGRNLHIEAVPQLRLRGGAGGVVIGDDVSILGRVDLRTRENGRIVIGDRVKLDESVRLVAANDATLEIGADTTVGCYCIFNCGADVRVGAQCLFAGFVYVQASDHGLARGIPIKSQPHRHAPIRIGDDCWLGSHVSVLRGVSIGDGAVIGSKSVVTADVPDQAIVAGVPAKQIGARSEDADNA